jgi:hypothetical protein
LDDRGDEWKPFLGWGNTLLPDAFLASGPSLLEGYRKKLMEDGVTPANADQVI